MSKRFDFIYNEYSKKDGTITSTHIIKFLDSLLLYDINLGAKITFIQWDNAKIHTSKAVKQFLKIHEDNLFVLHQPSYSPHLNPQEEIWHWMKDFISKASAVKDVQKLSKLIKRFKAYIDSRKVEVNQRLYARNWFG